MSPGSASLDSPSASLSPLSLSFGTQALGSTSNMQRVSLSNTGSATLLISSIGVSGDFTQSNNCGSTLAVGKNCAIGVIFAPTAKGTRSGGLNILDNVSGSPQAISLSGIGASSSATPSLTNSPDVSFSPAALTFGSQAFQTTSTAQSITLTNSGGAALDISSIAVGGSNASDFSQTNTCGSSVAAGANCKINLTFRPTASGARSAAVAFTDNAAGSPQNVSLSGTGAATGAAASLSPATLTFASQAVATTSAAQTITLSNSGASALIVTSIAVTGANASDFAQTNGCGSSVAAGGNCKISVTFKPTASGSRSAAVAFANNASGSPQSVSLSGTGAASPAVAKLSSSTLAFGNEAWDLISSSQAITLTNTGGASLSISSVAFTGADATDFTDVTTCGSSLVAGGSCTIAVLFTPSIIGSCSASLKITDNASGSPQAVSLSGTGILDVILRWVASTTAGVTGYNVYRGTTSGGESSTALNSTPISGTTYYDENVKAGTTYYYVLKSVGPSDTALSAPSNETVVTIP